MRTVIVFVGAMLAATSLSAAPRSLTYIVEEEPAKVIMVTLRQSDESSGGHVMDLRGGGVGGMRKVSLTNQEFDSLWAAFDQPGVSSFQFERKGAKDMSKAGHYTVELGGAGKIRTFRFSCSSCPSQFEVLVARMSSLIEKAKGGQPGATDNPGGAH